MNLELIRIDDVRALSNRWPVYKKGIERVLEFGRDDIDMNKVYNDLFAADPSMKLWEGHIDGEYTGFIVTKIYDSMPMNRIMLVYALFASSKLDAGIYIQAFQQMNDYAKLMGCKKMEFYTVRKGMQKLMEPYGWNLSHFVFQREVI